MTTDASSSGSEMGGMELEDNRPSESAGYFLTAGQDENYRDVM